MILEVYYKKFKGGFMFTPIQYQQSAQNVQAKVHEDIKEIKSKIANSGFIKGNDVLKYLDTLALRIDSRSKQILELLSLNEVSQSESFTPAEKMKLHYLHNTMNSYKYNFDNLLLSLSQGRGLVSNGTENRLKHFQYL